MIRIQCKGCGSKLNAKAKLAGQTAEVSEVRHADRDSGRGGFK